MVQWPRRLLYFVAVMHFFLLSCTLNLHGAAVPRAFAIIFANDGHSFRPCVLRMRDKCIELVPGKFGALKNRSRAKFLTNLPWLLLIFIGTLKVTFLVQSLITIKFQFTELCTIWYFSTRISILTVKVMGLSRFSNGIVVYEQFSVITESL